MTQVSQRTKSRAPRTHSSQSPLYLSFFFFPHRAARFSPQAVPQALLTHEVRTRRESRRGHRLLQAHGALVLRPLPVLLKFPRRPTDQARKREGKNKEKKDKKYRLCYP